MRSSVVVSVLLLSCSSASPVAGTPVPPPDDSGVALPVDAGAVDASVADSGVADSGVVDSGQVDSGVAGPPAPQVQVFPGRAFLQVNQSQQLTALVTGLEDQRVVWSLDGPGGTVTADGVFAAGNAPTTTTVRATSVARPDLSATATMTVTERPLPRLVRVTLSPSTARVSVRDRLQLSVSVTGATDPAVSFSATGGTISATGLFTAPDEPGFVAVRATSVEDPAQSATATLIVTNQVSVAITPSRAVLELGAQQRFTASVSGAPTNRVAWSATGGTVTDAGVFTGTTEGDFLVTAESVADPMQRASAMVNVSPIRVQVVPAAPTLDATASQQFFAQVTGTSNTSVTWTATGGTIDSNGLFLAGTVAGAYSVRATSVANPTRSAQAVGTIRPITVDVTPAMSALRIGTTRQFQALVRGSANQTVTWSVETPNGGTIAATGLYTAPSMPGVITVKATSVVDANAFALAVVAVQTAPIISVSITSPLTTQTVPQGGTQQFTAAVTGTPNTTLIWNSSGGTISSSGLFNAPAGTGAPGSYTVTATSQADPQQAASATVIVPPVTVTVTPATATVVAANSTNATPTAWTFSAAVTGASNSQVNWLVREAGGGTIGSGGTYQSPSIAGRFTVVARSVVDSAAEGTATVTVTPVPVVVSISPRNPTVGLGSTTAFTAAVANAATPGVNWSVADGGVGGQVDPTGRYTAPPRSGVDVLVATSREDSSRADSTTITVCNAGAVCSPPNACRIGNVSCTTAGGPSCVETATNAPNGTSCGPGSVCNAGVCTVCAVGSACTPGDPCALGVTSCLTGSARCENGGANPAKPDGSTCSPIIDGVCRAGRCVCNGNATFAFGDCQVCPVFTNTTVQVDANSLRGQDNACCGRTTTPGLGGPCLTIGQAVRNAQGVSWSVRVTPDGLGNVSQAEVYPIDLSRNVRLSLGASFVPGSAGVPVFRAKDDSTNIELNGGTIGVTSAGVAPGASAAFQVFSGDGGTRPSMTVLFTDINGTVDGLQVESGGAISYLGTIQRVTNAGISCRSTLIPNVAAFVYQNYQRNAGTVLFARYGAFLSSGCIASLGGSSFGNLTPNDFGDIACPTPRPLEYGIWMEGDARLTAFSGRLWCAAADGLSLRSNPLLPTNGPQANLDSAHLRRNGCAGLYVEAGRAQLSGAVVRNNHFGVSVSSAQGSADPLLAPVSLNGGGNRNEVLCNRARAGGACSTGAFASRGFNLFNNSGFVIDASNTNWGELPVGRCSCDPTLTSCSCAGSAFGLVAPPDGLSILNAPLVAGSPGVPSVVTTNASLSVEPVCR